MKTIYVVLAAIIVCCTASAQEFQGISLGQTLAELDTLITNRTGWSMAYRNNETRFAYMKIMSDFVPCSVVADSNGCTSNVPCFGFHQIGIRFTPAGVVYEINYYSIDHYLKNDQQEYPAKIRKVYVEMVHRYGVPRICTIKSCTSLTQSFLSRRGTANVELVRGKGSVKNHRVEEKPIATWHFSATKTVTLFSVHRDKSYQIRLQVLDTVIAETMNRLPSLR